MENLVFVVSILAIHVLAWLTPGPLTVLIIRNSLLYSRKAGVWTAVGIALGNVIHITYSVVAISLLISVSNLLLFIIKILGVGYLVYLAVATFRADSKVHNDIGENLPTNDLAPFQAAKTGFIVSVLSPKSPPYFMSIFAAVFATGQPMWVVIFLWAAMPFNSFIMACLHTLIFTHGTFRAMYARHERFINVLLGGALLLLALLIILNT